MKKKELNQLVKSSFERTVLPFDPIDFKPDYSEIDRWHEEHLREAQAKERRETIIKILNLALGTISLIVAIIALSH